MATETHYADPETRLVRFPGLKIAMQENHTARHRSIDEIRRAQTQTTSVIAFEITANAPDRARSIRTHTYYAGRDIDRNCR